MPKARDLTNRIYGDFKVIKKLGIVHESCGTTRGVWLVACVKCGLESEKKARGLRNNKNICYPCQGRKNWGAQVKTPYKFE
jgi:hypothetical protein